MMAFKLVLVLCALVAQVIGAPKLCVSNCYAGGSSTSTSYEAMSGIQTHGNPLVHQSAAFQQLHQDMLNALHQQYAKHDFSAPGSWDRQNSYRTPNGGQVYEEHGKKETANSHMQYFKQNYTHEWSSNKAGVNTAVANNQLAHGGGGFSGSFSGHNHHDITVTGGNHRDERLEDFGTTTQVDTHATDVVYNQIINMINSVEGYLATCTNNARQGSVPDYQKTVDVVQQYLDRMRSDMRQYGLYDRLLTQVNTIETHLAEFKRLVETHNRYQVRPAPVVQQVAPVQPGYQLTVTGGHNSEFKVHGSVPGHVVPNENVILLRPTSTYGGSQGGSYGSTHSGVYGTTHSGSYGGSHGGSYGGSHGGSYGGSQGGSYEGSHGSIQGANGYGQTKVVEDSWHAGGSHKETTSGSHASEGYVNDCHGSYCSGQTEPVSGCAGRDYGTLCRRSINNGAQRMG